MINPAKPDYQLTPASPQRAHFDFVPIESVAPPVVTIVTPFYNAGTVFYETAQSVFRQSLQQWEWLIINDGSTTPEALAILEEYRHKDPRIRVVEHPCNQGLSAARNTGFREASAQFVFQLDADDLIEPTTLEKMVWHLATHPELGFTTGYTVGFGAKEYLWRNGFHNGRRFLQENMVTATNLVRKSVHQAIGGYDEAICGGLEDWDFWLKAAAHGYWGSTIPEYFDWYRRRVTGREHWKNLVEKEKFEQFQARLQQRYAGLERQFPGQAGIRQQMSSSVAAELPFRNLLAKSKKRLMLLVPHFEVGGADKFNLNLIEQLQRKHGYEVTVIATKPANNAWLHEFEALTPDVFALNNFLQPDDFPLFLRYLITSRQPDVLCLSNSHLAYQLLPYLRACFPALPIVDYLHMEEESWMSGGYPHCSIVYQNQLSKTVVSSHHLKNWMCQRGGSAGNIEVCYTNVDPGVWSPARHDSQSLAKKWDLNGNLPVILYAGRICDQKQPKVFAEVMRRLARKHLKFTALVAGDGPDLPNLKEFVEREGLRQVRFLGEVPNQGIAELLTLTDIFFLPSQWEGISLAFYEAMAMGVVPVGADVGGQRELVTPECGFLVKRGADEASLYTSVLAKLLSNPELRDRMAKAAQERIAAKFHLDAMGAQISRVFELAAQSPTPNAGLLSNRVLANLHAAEVVDQVRLANYVDHLLKEHTSLLPYVKASVEWQSALRTALALAALKQKDAAIRSLEEGVKAAVNSRMLDLELSARIELARAMIPLNPRLAAGILEAAVPLAAQSPDRKSREALEALLKTLGASNSRPNGAETSPLVSVIIPCYKQAHFLAESVESVIAQTFTDWELIIVNDGSPDNTSEVANNLIAKYSDQCLRLVEKPNGGLPSARNAGIRAAQGRYILPLDADDCIRPSFLKKLVAVLNSQPAVGFAYTHIQHFGALDTEYPLPDFNRATLLSKDNIACVCGLFRKAAWEQVGGYNEAMVEGYEDWDFWVGCVEHGWEGYCLHEPLFLYRKSGASMLTSANLKRDRLIAQIISNHPKLYDDRSRQWATTLLAHHAADKATAQDKVSVAASISAPSSLPLRERRSLRITYLISNIRGVTGGNQTLLRQANVLVERGHQVTIVTCTPPPNWFDLKAKVIQVSGEDQMGKHVPPSDAVISTYFTNTAELLKVNCPVKLYYAQGDQYVFSDADLGKTDEFTRLMKKLSRVSYTNPTIRFIANSHNLANAVERNYGRKADAILPVCTDQTIFHPLPRPAGPPWRILVVGPDLSGSSAEPLDFKGLRETREALELLNQRGCKFKTVRMSGTPPEIFRGFPCEFHLAPGDDLKTQIYGSSQILIYASHYDSCPRPPQEAMAAGAAVVCTATDGAMEYCRDGVNALLVPVRSPVAIADAVQRLMDDVPLWEKLVAGGLATAAEYPREREWDELEDLLVQYVDQARSGKSKSAAPASAHKPVPPKGAPITLPPCAFQGQLTEARQFFQQKKLTAAWGAVRAALKHRPFHPEAYLLLAEIALAAHDSVAARACAQFARQIAPEFKPAKKFLKASLHGNLKPDWLVLPEVVRDPHALRHPHLSVCLITKNEERFLGQCLDSVKGLADQIVVVDTGSTDRTVEIAKHYGAQVHAFAWCDDFSAARNAALEHVTGDWVLMLDADEELPMAQHEALRKLLRAAAVISWRLPLQDVGREAEGCSYVPRLFRNAPGLFYVGRVHEQVFTSLEVRRQEWGLETRLGDATLRHYGYTKELTLERDKVGRNLRLLELAVQEAPGDANLLMNYGLELTRSNRPEEGLRQYRAAFEAMTEEPPALVVPESREMLLTQFCAQLMAAKRHAEIVQVLTSPVAKLGGGLTASLHFTLGLAQMELQASAAAAEQFRQCLAKRDRPALTPVNLEIRKAGPRHCLALCLAQTKEFAAAEREFQAARRDDPESASVVVDYARFLHGQGQSVEGLQLLHQFTSEHPQATAAWLAGGALALSRPEFLEVAMDWTEAAFGQLPEDAAIQRQRAEALLLAGQPEAALSLWRTLESGGQPATLGALILCETAVGNNVSAPAPALAAAVTQEFVQWYRRLLEFGAEPTVRRVNVGVAGLERVLPRAAELLRAVIAEANEPDGGPP